MLTISSDLPALDAQWQASQYLHGHFDREDGLERADKALYAAKRSGRDQLRSNDTVTALRES